MKITEVEAIHLRVAYHPDRTFQTPAGPVHGRLTTLIRLRTDEGLTGWGSAYAHPGVVDAVVDHLTPFVLGYDPVDTARHWNRLHSLSGWYGRKGAAVAAISGIDTAMWDLRGQITGEPIWKMLGGTTSAAPAYASGLLYSSPEAVAEGAAEFVRRGFRRVKMRAGWNWDYDLAAVSAARAVLGADNDLLVDGTWRFTLEHAKAFADVLADHDVFWFEEPFAVDDIDSFVALRAHSRVPLTTGENEFALHGFREHLRAGTVDIVQADASRAGGITEVVAIGNLAAEYGVALAPHTWCDAVAVVANAHIVAALPNGLTCEVDQTGNAFIDALLGDRLPITNGLLELGERPGLGITVDEEFVAAHRVHDPRAIPDGNYCDLVYGRGQTRYIGDYVGPGGAPA